MGSLSDIKRRLVSVKQTRRITSAMKTVSVAKMRKLLDMHENFSEYAELLERIAKAVSGADSEYFTPINIDGDMLVVLSSDRGLCGGFDHDILKLADGLIGKNTVIVPVGSVAARHFVGKDNVISDFADRYGTEHSVAEDIARYVLNAYGKSVGRVNIVYSAMQSKSTFKPVVKTLLPVERPDETIELAVEPSPTDVIDTLVPMYLSATVYGAFIDNAVSENCARSAAMTAATDSADELISKLSIEYNRARQATVTQQITEITGAVGAIGDQGDGQ